MLTAKPRKTVDSVEKIILILEMKNEELDDRFVVQERGWFIGFLVVFLTTDNSPSISPSTRGRQDEAIENYCC
jgi:hypothetical protein